MSVLLAIDTAAPRRCLEERLNIAIGFDVARLVGNHGDAGHGLDRQQRLEDVEDHGTAAQLQERLAPLRRNLRKGIRWPVARQKNGMECHAYACPVALSVEATMYHGGGAARKLPLKCAMKA